jgi:hypothetical protein
MDVRIILSICIISFHHPFFWLHEGHFFGLLGRSFTYVIFAKKEIMGKSTWIKMRVWPLVVQIDGEGRIGMQAPLKAPPLSPLATGKILFS